MVRRVGRDLPFSFEPNVGQAPPDVAFMAHRGSTVFLFSSNRVLIRRGERTLELAVPGAREVAGRAELLLPGRSNYLIGSDPAHWRTGLPSYARVRFSDIYPGIHLLWHGEGGQLEFDFVVEPGADVSAIRLVCAAKLEVPRLYQSRDDGTPLAVAGRLVAGHDGTWGFETGPYDPALQLIIDPVLSYSTYLGGGNGNDTGAAIAVDASGNTYTTGTTPSPFPIRSALQPTFGGGLTDAFITKLSPVGGLLYSTYLGGTSSDKGYGIAVDASGSAYVAGHTSSVNFPILNAAQPSARGNAEGFVAKLTPAGNALAYSTYIGGSGADYALAIAVDPSGRAHVAGQTAFTASMDFPTSSPLQAAYGGGSFDGFVATISAPGNSFVYSTYLGGSADDWVWGIATDASGNAYVTGQTASTNFPTASPVQPALAGPQDAFVTGLSPTGALTYSTYLGGSGGEVGNGIAVDASGAAYVTGYTGSSDLATVSAVQPMFGGGNLDVFVSKLAPLGAAVSYATYLGINGDERGQGIAVDAAGCAYVTGSATAGFPTVAPVQTSGGGLADSFVSKLSPTGTALLFSTLLGGTGTDVGNAIAVDSQGSVYVTGQASSSDFPTLRPAQAVSGGGLEVVVYSIIVDGGPDAGALDAGALDAGALDAGALDAGALDAGALDAGALDAGALDAGAPDSGAPDSGAPDSGAPDSGAPDSGAPDSGAPDSVLPDSGAPDLGHPGDTTSERYAVGCGCSSVPSTWWLMVSASALACRRRGRDRSAHP
ncbi:MAG: SBBP repeat-containing protein [Archangiaceae bacterium]|nr:SBBP repeat-containing protein [Archangiaceae bacterium]